MYTLKITISDAYKYLVNILLFDANDRIIKNFISDNSKVAYKIEQGLYTLRIEMNGDISDEVIFLDENMEYTIGNKNTSSTDTSKTLSPPAQFSSALLGDNYGSTHDYYLNPAISWSKKNTLELKPAKGNNNSSLFIFLRFLDVENYRNLTAKSVKPFFSGFEIVDEFGKSLAQFESKNGIEVNDQDGWIAFNAQLPVGVYYLIYKGKDSRQIPIYVFNNWHTQFFMTLGKQPIYETIRIFLSKERKFNPHAKDYKYIDILLDKLQDHDYNLDDELITIATREKYKSPMLALICSYIYMKSDNNKKDKHFKEIMHNLKNIILHGNENCPDLHALEIIASEHFESFYYDKKHISATPMFRIGFEAIQKAACDDDEMIQQDDINDFVSENLYFDSPFCTFKPIDFKKLNINKTAKVNPPKKAIIDDKPKILEDILNHDFIRSMKKTISIEKKDSWLTNAVMDIVKKNDENNIAAISQKTGVTYSTIVRVLNQKQKTTHIKKVLSEKKTFGFIKEILESEKPDSIKYEELKNYFKENNLNPEELRSLIKFLMRKKVNVNKNQELEGCLKEIIQILKKAHDEKHQNLVLILDDFFNKNEKNYRAKKIDPKFIETIKDHEFLELTIDYYGKRNYNLFVITNTEELLNCFDV